MSVAVPDRGPSDRTRRRALRWAAAACLCALLTLTSSAHAAMQAAGGPTPLPKPNVAPPLPPAAPPPGLDQPELLPPGKREAATTVKWTEGPARRFLWSPGKIWRVIPETGVTGWLVRPGDRREIRQTRLRIDEERPGKDLVLGWVQHTANTEVSILLPGDPRLRNAGPAVEDSLRPWPNPCSLLPYELDRSIDLNLNDRMELPLSCTASLGDPAGTRVLLLEADEKGKPRLVPASEFVGVIRFDEGIITSIRFPAGAKDPVLEAQLLPLYNCRYLARLGIRGEEACRTCCLVQIVLRRDPKEGDGLFKPVYDKPSQAGLLNRLRTDLSVVQLGGTGPLSPPEEVALARAAAFFYLTGTGSGTRAQLLKALGTRAAIPQSMQLLGRLDRYFLLNAK